MIKSIFYTLNRMRKTNLENQIVHSTRAESEEEMALNKSKIRRQIEVNGTKVWITAHTEQEYVNKLLRLANATPHSVSKEKHVFEDYARNWFEVFSKPNVAYVTGLTYERQLKYHILPVLGRMNLEDITSADVQKVFNNMGRDMTQESKNKVKIVLNQIFKMAIEDGFINRNPLQSSIVKIKGKSSSVTEPYTVEQMRYLANHLGDIPNPMDRAWLALSISLPLRPEEVLGLTWANVDVENCTIHVCNTVTHPTRNAPEFKPYTKTTSSVRDLAFPREILRYLPKCGRPNDFVIGGFCPITYTQLRGIRKRIAKAINFEEGITPRRFRTTVATDISATTHDLKLVQQMLGHSTPQMTLKHYDKGRSRTIDASTAIENCYGLKKKDAENT